MGYQEYEEEKRHLMSPIFWAAEDKTTAAAEEAYIIYQGKLCKSESHCWC